MDEVVRQSEKTAKETGNLQELITNKIRAGEVVTTKVYVLFDRNAQKYFSSSRFPSHAENLSGATQYNKSEAFEVQERFGPGTDVIELEAIYVETNRISGEELVKQRREAYLKKQIEAHENEAKRLKRELETPMPLPTPEPPAMQW